MYVHVDKEKFYHQIFSQIVIGKIKHSKCHCFFCNCSLAAELTSTRAFSCRQQTSDRHSSARLNNFDFYFQCLAFKTALCFWCYNHKQMDIKPCIWSSLTKVVKSQSIHRRSWSSNAWPSNFTDSFCYNLEPTGCRRPVSDAHRNVNKLRRSNFHNASKTFFVILRSNIKNCTKYFFCHRNALLPSFQVFVFLKVFTFCWLSRIFFFINLVI